MYKWDTAQLCPALFNVYLGQFSTSTSNHFPESESIRRNPLQASATTESLMIFASLCRARLSFDSIWDFETRARALNGTWMEMQKCILYYSWALTPKRRHSHEWMIQNYLQECIANGRQTWKFGNWHALFRLRMARDTVGGQHCKLGGKRALLHPDPECIHLFANAHTSRTFAENHRDCWPHTHTHAHDYNIRVTCSITNDSPSRQMANTHRCTVHSAHCTLLSVAL